MSLARPLWLSASIGLSTLVIGFVAADRLAHTPPAPVPGLARAPVREPETTGTVTQQAAAEARPLRLVNGFDTERLNALMRGEAGPAPQAARRR